MIIDLHAADAFSAASHAGQTRNIGDASAPDVPYIVHPRAVRAVLEHEHPSADVKAPWLLAVALLHDVLEDCDVHPDELTRRFGADVCGAVRALSKQLRAVAAARKTNDQYWTVLAQSPLPVRQVKAADRIDNLRSCLRWPRPDITAKYLVETPQRVLPLIVEDPWLYATLCDLLAALRRKLG